MTKKRTPKFSESFIAQYSLQNPNPSGEGLEDDFLVIQDLEDLVADRGVLFGV